MGVASRYWIFVRVNSFGRCKSDVLEEAKAFFNEQFPGLVNKQEIPDKDIQIQLMQWYQSSEPHYRQRAEECLSCFISYVLKECCIALEQKNSQKYDLYKAELLPLVLDTTHRSTHQQNRNNQDSEQSLTTQILETFNPNRSNLSTWVTIKFKSSSAIKKCLKEHGIVQLTDWSILRYTTHTRLKRVFSNLQRTPIETTKALKLLDSFHRIYCTQLPLYRKTKTDSKFNTTKYPKPEDEQLNQIAAILYKDVEYVSNREIMSPEEVLEELQKLAGVLRETWTKSSPSVKPSKEPVSNLPEYCIEPFNACLDKSIERVIENCHNYIQRKGTRKGKEQGKKYLEALSLFHCDGDALTKIARELGFTDQAHLSRLLKLKTLRKDIGRNLVLELTNYVKELSKCSDNPEKLLELDRQIQNMFGSEIDELIKEAEREARNGHRLVMNSKLSLAICKCLNHSPCLNN